MPKSQQIGNTDPRVDYNGSWQLSMISFTRNNKTIARPMHSTADNSSSVFFPFSGSQIRVFGLLPPGQGELVAKYYIDSSSRFTKKHESALTQNASLPHQLLFESPILGIGEHNLTIEVIETGSDRNYTLSHFSVYSGEELKAATSNKTTEIVLGVLCGVLLLLAMAFGIRAALQWRNKRLQMTQTDFEKQYNQTMNSSKSPSWHSSDSTITHNESHGSVAESTTRHDHTNTVGLEPRSVPINPFILPGEDTEEGRTEQSQSREVPRKIVMSRLPSYSSLGPRY